MPPSTADQVLNILTRYELTAKSGGRYQSNSPLRPGSNSHAFSLIINGPEHGAFVDYVSGDKGSLYELAALLGIETPKSDAATERRLVATYDYVDADGTLLYQACRHEPGRNGRKKDFSQRVPDGQGGWHWTMDGVVRVLYRLPEVLAAVAAGAPIYIVEGEKDADLLTLYGLTATTNVGGAGKWRSDYSAVLAGASIIVLPDNDAPGAKHADTVAASLYGLASLKIIALPDLPPKGDVSDWLAAGHTIDELHALVAATEPYTPPALAAEPAAAPTLGPTARLAQAILSAGYRCVLNTESDEITINGALMSDITRSLLRSDVRDRRLGPTEILDDAVVLQAQQHAQAPIRDGLAALQWDGKTHISRLGACLQTDAADRIHTAAGQPRAAEVFLLRWLLGAVGRVVNGDQNAMLVLDGPQGIGKSAFVKWLGSVLPGVYCEESISPQEKDCLLRLTSTLVWEAGELDGTTRKHDVAALKHFLTRSTVIARRSYGRHDITKPVLTSFIGTVNTNGNGFLPDPTGNRRYLVLSLTGIDWSYPKCLDPRQVWAEAVARYQMGERGVLSAEEASYRDTVNAERHLLTGLMDDWLTMHFRQTGDPSDMLTSGEIAAHLATKDIHLGGNDRAAAMAIADALTRAGVNQADRRAAKKRYGTFQRAWAGIQTKDSAYFPPAGDDDEKVIQPDPTSNQPRAKVGSSHQEAANLESDPTDPTYLGERVSVDEKVDVNQSGQVHLRDHRAAATPKVHGSVGSVGSGHQEGMIQPSTRLDQHEEVGSPPSAPARLYKPSVDERMRRIKDTRNLLREYGTVKELKLNLEALSWGQLTDLEDQLLHRKVSG